MRWRTVKDAIDTETRSIWSVEPDDVKRLRLGLVPTEAGSFGQYFSTLVFALTYSLTLGEHVVYGLVKGADNEAVTLESLKELTREHFGSGFESPSFLGYVLAPKAHTYGNDILAVIGEIETRDDFKALLGAYFTYLNILHWWLHIYFPWYLGSAYPQVSREQLAEMNRLWLPPVSETRT